MRQAPPSWLETTIFARRPAVLGLFAVVTLVLAVAAAQLRIDAGFAKWLPLEHPYTQTFLRYKAEFGGANRLLIAVRAREGDIFTPDVFERLQRLTEAVRDMPGVDRGRVRSIFTPDTRFVEIVEGGFVGDNVVPAGFEPSPAEIARVRENILKADLVGRLVAKDLSAAMVSAELIDAGPAGGGAPDRLELARLLEAEIREPFSDELADIHIIGFSKAAGEIAEGARAVVVFFGVALSIAALLLYLFTRSIPLTALPLACSLLAVVWTLGLLRILGYGLDPISTLVPFLIFAIGVSHGVQMVNAFMAHLCTGSTSLDAAREAFRRLLLPGSTALLSDALGFLTILVIAIAILQELAITAALGVLALVLTNLILLPVALSYVTVTPARAGATSAEALRSGIAMLLGGFARPRGAALALLLALALLTFALPRAAAVKVGDLQAGLPELHPESRYNRDAAFIAEQFSIGMDVLQVVGETVPDGCVDYEIMSEIDRFQWHMANVPGVQSTLSLPQVAKVSNARWNEGSLAWRVLPRDRAALAQAIAPVETSSGLLNGDCSAMPVLIFTADHRAETIERLVSEVEHYVQGEETSGRLAFRLAGGNLGVMAASNQVVEAAQVPMVVYIYAAVTALCLLAFRSLRDVLCIILPLGLVSVLVWALMSLLGIGLKVATLPVAALGVGIGVDYGIYIFSHLKSGLERGLSIAEAYAAALRAAGTAVLLTGASLTIAAGTWIFSPLQFQADMGLLLAFMFLANMLGALFLLPALARILYSSLPRRLRRPAL